MDDNDLFSPQRSDSIYSAYIDDDDESEIDYVRVDNKNTGKTQEKLIETIRKENFELKLKIYNEQQNTDKYKNTIINYEQKLNDLQNELDVYEHEKKTFQITISKLRNEIQELKKENINLKSKIEVKNENQEDPEMIDNETNTNANNEKNLGKSSSDNIKKIKLQKVVSEGGVNISQISDNDFLKSESNENTTSVNDKYFNKYNLKQVDIDYENEIFTHNINSKVPSVKRNLTQLGNKSNLSTNTQYFTGKHVNISESGAKPFYSSNQKDIETPVNSKEHSKGLFGKLMHKIKNKK